MLRLLALCFSAATALTAAIPSTESSKMTRTTRSEPRGIINPGDQLVNCAFKAPSTTPDQAVTDWHDDTAAVSSFLDRAGNGEFTTLDAFISAAQSALCSENDELARKAVLDGDAKVQQDSKIGKANDLLVTQMNFQNVVTNLGIMGTDPNAIGAKSFEERKALMATTNAGRCTYVLPAIDAYFAAAGHGAVKAMRPAACENGSIQPAVL